MLEKIAVIGVGAWGINHVKILSILKADGIIGDLVVVDVIEDRARYVGRQYGVEWKTSVDDVIRDDGIVGAVVAIPTKYHYDVACRLIDAGIHLLVEKPITGSASKALDLIDRARAANLVLMVGLLLRYSKATQYVRNLYVDRGKELGEVISIAAKRYNPPSRRASDISVVEDLAIHDIDLARYIFGGVPKAVYAAMVKDVGRGQDHATVIVEYDHGEGTYRLLSESSRMAPQKYRSFEVTMERAIFLLDLSSHVVEAIYPDKREMPNLGPSNPLLDQDRNFIYSIMKKEKCLADATDGYNALVVCEAIHKSISSGEKVWIDKRRLIL